MTGGPGTGKTHTVARILAASFLVAEGRDEAVRVALAAPTGKAAGRMKDAVDARVAELASDGLVDARKTDRLRGVIPTTIHTLLGAKGLAVLTVDDQRVLHGFFNGDASGHAGAISAFSNHPLRRRLHACFAE